MRINPLQITLYLLLALIGVYVLVLNIFTPLLPGDDFLYQRAFYSPGESINTPITSLAQFLTSIKNHFLFYNNRIFPHALLQLILLLSPIFFDFLNTAVLLILPFLILKPFKTTGKENKLKLYFLILLAILILHPDIAWSYLWTTGSLNYSWMLIPQLYLLGAVYRKSIYDTAYGWKEIIASLIVSTANEHILLALFLAHCLLVAKGSRYRKDVYLICSTGLLLIGGIIMLQSLSFQSRIIGDLSAAIFKENLIRLLYYQICIVPLALLFTFFKKLEIRKRPDMTLLLVYFASLIVMLFSPLYEARSAVFPFFVALMISTSMLKSYKGFRYYILWLGMGMVLWLYAPCLAELKRLNKTALENYSVLEINKGNDIQLQLQSFCTGLYNRRIPCDDITMDSSHFHNQSLSRYYNLGGVKQKALLSDQELEALIHDKLTPVKDFTMLKLDEDILSGLSIEGAYYMKDKSDGTGKIIVKYRDQKLDSNQLGFVLRSDGYSIISRMLECIPKRPRIYLMRFLETQQQLYEVENYNFSVIPVGRMETHRYFLLSCYDLKKHEVNGRIIRFDSSNFQSFEESYQ